MIDSDEILRLNLARAAATYPDLAPTLEAAARRLGVLDVAIRTVASSRRHTWASATDEASNTNRTTVWDTEDLENAVTAYYGILPPADLMPAHPPEHRDEEFTFGELAARARFRGYSVWDAYIYDRWAAAMRRNPDRPTNGAGPLTSFGIVGDSYPAIFASLGRERGERKDSNHAATADEIVAFRRVANRFARGLESNLRALSIDVGDGVIEVESDESNPERGSWGLTYRSVENPKTKRRIETHMALTLMDQLVDAGVYVRHDMLSWAASGYGCGTVAKYEAWASRLS